MQRLLHADQGRKSRFALKNEHVQPVDSLLAFGDLHSRCNGAGTDTQGPQPFDQLTRRFLPVSRRMLA